MALYCIHCGQAIEPAARFCARCGRAVHTHPDQAAALMRGLQSMREGNTAAAIEHLQRALDRESDRFAAQLALATLCLQQRAPALAERHLRDALVLKPNHAQAHALLGSTLALEFRFDNARDALDTAVLLSPNDWLVRVTRAEFFFKLGFFSDALKELECASRLPCSDPVAAQRVNLLLLETRARARRGFTRQPLPFDLGGLLTTIRARFKKAAVLNG